MKAEKIKLEWNKVLRRTEYSAIQHYISDNGWISLNALSHDERLLIREVEINGDFIRPYTLAGIENNNGWVKIESEDDLPKENIDCFVMFTDGTTSVDSYHYQTSNFMRNHKNHINYYKPIPKPKPPIY